MTLEDVLTFGACVFVLLVLAVLVLLILYFLPMRSRRTDVQQTHSAAAAPITDDKTEAVQIWHAAHVRQLKQRKAAGEDTSTAETAENARRWLLDRQDDSGKLHAD